MDCASYTKTFYKCFLYAFRTSVVFVLFVKLLSHYLLIFIFASGTDYFRKSCEI